MRRQRLCILLIDKTLTPVQGRRCTPCALHDHELRIVIINSRLAGLLSSKSSV
jgi:hypothetical protein